MKPTIRTFDSHEEAGAFALAERLAIMPAQRLKLYLQPLRIDGA